MFKFLDFLKDVIQANKDTRKQRAALLLKHGFAIWE